MSAVLGHDGEAGVGQPHELSLEDLAPVLDEGFRIAGWSWS
jgi:hypothetical protein